MEGPIGIWPAGCGGGGAGGPWPRRPSPLTARPPRRKPGVPAHGRLLETHTHPQYPQPSHSREPTARGGSTWGRTQSQQTSSITRSPSSGPVKIIFRTSTVVVLVVLGAHHHSSVARGGRRRRRRGRGRRCGRPTAGSPDQMDTPDRPRAAAAVAAGFEVRHLARGPGPTRPP